MAAQLSSPVFLTTAWKRVFRAGELGFICEIEVEFKRHLIKTEVEV